MTKDKMRPKSACQLTFLILIIFTERSKGNSLRNSTEEKVKSTRSDHPLLSVLSTQPHSMSLMLQPQEYEPDTMVRLLYERVAVHKQPDLQQLSDPVIEYIPLTRRAQSHEIEELPMGKYIVCGEALIEGQVKQASCFETRIERLDNNSK